MKCRRCQSSLQYSLREAFSPIGSRPCVSPKRSSTVGSFARWVFSISRRKRSSSSVRTRRALLGLPAAPLDEAPTILFHEDALSGLLRVILHRLAGIPEPQICRTNAGWRSLLDILRAEIDSATRCPGCCHVQLNIFDRRYVPVDRS